MSLFRMTIYRFKKILSWILAIVLVALLAFGGYYLWVVL